MATANHNTGNLEQKIIEAARETFLNRGYSETSMSDIAVRAGINRPTLHYYFRTKERMFGAVFGSIFGALVPRVKDIILRSDIPIGKRVQLVIDAYYEVFKENPRLPLFIVKEIDRDYDNVVRTARELGLQTYMDSIRKGLQDEMDSGKLRQVPMRYLFMTFYSMLIIPFATCNLCNNLFVAEGECFDDMLAEWKAYIVSAVERTLTI